MTAPALLPNNLAQVLSRQGKYEEAEGIHRQTLALKETVLGEKHPSTLASMNNLAFTWRERGRAIEAISLMEECSQLQNQVPGPGHPYTKASLETLYGWKDGGHEVD